VVIRTEKDLAKLDHYLSGLAPVIVELDNAISQMRIYALAQVARLPKQKYNQFFTEGKHSELENLLDKAFLTIGIEVPDWASVLKGSR
jgi:G:T/U-mismatch repair DNA glycosylase